MSCTSGSSVRSGEHAVQRSQMPADPHLLAGGFLFELCNAHSLTSFSAECRVIRAVVFPEMETGIFHQAGETHMDTASRNARAHGIWPDHFRGATASRTMSDGQRPGNDVRDMSGSAFESDGGEDKFAECITNIHACGEFD